MINFKIICFGIKMLEFNIAKFYRAINLYMNQYAKDMTL